MAKYIVTLTEEERSWLRHLVSVGKAAARKLTHARILLLADANPEGSARHDEDIQQALGGWAVYHLSSPPAVRHREYRGGPAAAAQPSPPP